MLIYIKRSLFLALAFSLSVAPATCQTFEGALDSLSLKELLNVKVTTATKTLQETDIAPATVLVISKEQIRSRGYQSLLDLLLDLPDVKVDDKVYTGQRNSIVIRGIQGQHNLTILLDGVKISSPTNEALPVMENYPLHIAEQVEVVYGPASALYGADAVSGVINIITKKLSTGDDANIHASTVVGTYGYSNTTLHLAKKLSDQASLVVAGQYAYDKQPDYSKIYADDAMYNVDHYKEGTFNTVYGPMKVTVPISSKYQSQTMAYNIYAALHLDNFTVSAFTNYTRTPSAWGNNTHNAVYNNDVYMGQSVSVLNASYRKQIGRVGTLTSLSASRYTLDPGSNYSNVYTGMQKAYKYSSSLSMRIEEQMDYSISAKLNLIGGFSYEKFSTIPQSADLEAPVDLNRSISGTYAGTTAYYRPEGLSATFYNIIYQNSGAFLQAQYVPNQILSFTLGARYDYNSRFGTVINPRVGMVLKPSVTTNVKLLYGSAYLAPPVSTAYVTYGSFQTNDSGKTYTSSFLHLPNPHLGPVRSRNIELSMQQYLTNNFSITADGYYSLSKGLMTFANDNSTTRLYNNSYNGIPIDYIEVFINEGEQITYGGSIKLNLKHTIKNIFLNTYASFSYVDGYKHDNLNSGYRTQLPFIAGFLFRMGTDIRAGRFTCSPRLLIMSRQNISGIRDTTGSLVRLQTIPGYTLLNLSMRYEIGRRLSVFANVTNALNQRYRSVGFNMDLTKTETDILPGQPQDPIRFYGGICLDLN